LARSIEELISSVKSYRTPLGKFVDREHEVAKILGEIGFGLSIVVGPLGCGKTTLADAITRALAEDDERTAIYVAHREEAGTAKSIVMAPRFSSKELKDIFAELVDVVSGYVAELRGIVTLIDVLLRICRRVGTSVGEILVFVDEFRSRAEEARQGLEIDANYVARMLVEGMRIKVLYLTSDATATKLQLEMGSKARWYIVWNLPREAFEELYNVVRPRIDFEIVWRLVGGNPRELKALVEDHGHDVESYVGEKIAMVRNVIEEFVREEKVSLREAMDEIKILVEDIDVAGYHRIWSYVLEKNIVIDIDERFRKLSSIPREPWIGKENAFQIPIYYWIFKTIARYGEATPKRILEEIGKA